MLVHTYELKAENERDNNMADFIKYTHGGLKTALSLANNFGDITEIRVRINAPLIIKTVAGEFFITAAGFKTDKPELAYKPTSTDIEQTVESIAGHSRYAFAEEIKNGYITMLGGHRVGIAGKCIIENGNITSIKNITSLCFRVSRHISGCGDKVLPQIMKSEITICNTIIISPPGCGKTTLLRDIIRLLNNKGLNIGVADERNEIGGNINIGCRADVLTSCPKADGMKMLLRSMCPDIIAADEIGSLKDIEAISEIINAGVKILCTAHGYGVDDLRKRPSFMALLDMGIVERFVVLGRSRDNVPGEVLGVY